MKYYESREKILSALGEAYIDVKNNDAICLMIVLRPNKENDVLASEIISFGLDEDEAKCMLFKAMESFMEEE